MSSKPRGFIEIPHKAPQYRDVEERITDFNEVEINLTDAEIIEQATRCMDCGIPFCHGCGCPLGNYVPEWNDLVGEGYWEEALKVLLSTNEFPEFTGKICPALCEGSCTAGLNGDSVTIKQIELKLIEKGFENGWIQPFIPTVRTGKKVAVVGGGPAGLALASRLNKFGHEVTVFEKDKEPGGLLRYGIPDFKLEKKTVARRVKLLKKSGIKFECDIEPGKDISGDYLLKKFDAVALTCGAMIPRNIDVANRDSEGIYFAMNFLRQQNMRVSGEKINENEISAENKKVVVIGGGDTGSDCVGTAIRQNASSVTQLEIMPKPPLERSNSTPWPLWPYKLRTSSSHKEGCRRVWSIMTTGFESIEGKVVKVNTVKVEWKLSEEGAPVSFEKIEGSESSIKADLVLLAMGFTGAEKSDITKQLEVQFTKRGNIEISDAGQVKCKSDKVFAAGDAANGASLVVRAMQSGVELAQTINDFLQK